RGMTSFENPGHPRGGSSPSGPVPTRQTGISGMKEKRMAGTSFRLVFLGLVLLGGLGSQTSCDNGCPSCSRQESQGTTTRHDSPGVAGSSGNPTEVEIAAVLELRVAILDFKFEPETLTVSPGTKVTWVNKDDEPHTATSSEKPKRFDSGVLDTAQSYSFTFVEPGSYPYFCKLHPHMTGVIVVK
ncbi:MAG TPA: cupredoxin family copper-binding protein, partial [Planctomycetota bacterium]|nr:cupredoxin family copper-binding protein [Planctomycetota bacterium]